MEPIDVVGMLDVVLVEPVVKPDVDVVDVDDDKLA